MKSMTVAEYRRMCQQDKKSVSIRMPKKNKYNARRVMYKGIEMDSGLEKECAMVLEEQFKQVLSMTHHENLIIWTAQSLRDDIRHEADFVLYLKNGITMIVEAKGRVLQDYRIKRKLLIDCCITSGMQFWEYTRKKGLQRII